MSLLSKTSKNALQWYAGIRPSPTGAGIRPFQSGLYCLLGKIVDLMWLSKQISVFFTDGEFIFMKSERYFSIESVDDFLKNERYFSIKKRTLF